MRVGLVPAQKWHNTGMMRAVDRDYVEVVEMIGAVTRLFRHTHWLHGTA